MNMTLDEAIEHCDEVVQKEDCSKCAKEHEQLKEWLEELKELKNPQPYKFEELETNLTVFDKALKELVLIGVMCGKHISNNTVPYFRFGDKELYTVNFEEERFFPVTKAMEYQE